MNMKIDLNNALKQYAEVCSLNGVYFFRDYKANIKSIDFYPAEKVRELSSFLAMERPKKPFTICADEDAGLDFIATVVASMKDEEKEAILSRSLILDDNIKWNSLTIPTPPLCLILRPDITKRIFSSYCVYVGEVQLRHHIIGISPIFTITYNDEQRKQYVLL